MACCLVKEKVNNEESCERPKSTTNNQELFHQIYDYVLPQKILFENTFFFSTDSVSFLIHDGEKKTKLRT